MTLKAPTQVTDVCRCASCGRSVKGCDGDAKVYVEHEQIVLCATCFYADGRRDSWTAWSPATLRRSRRMIRG
jgi:hypothetical protein